MENTVSRLINLYHQLMFNLEQNRDRSRDQRQEVFLLGQGWFAKGFMENIDTKKYSICNIARHSFVNTPMIFSKINNAEHIILHGQPPITHVDRFRKYFTQEHLDETVESIDPDMEVIFTDKACYSFADKYVVCGLGSHVDNAIYWNRTLALVRALPSMESSSVCVIGAGLSGTELAFYLADRNHMVTIYDTLPMEKLYDYLSSHGKAHVVDRLHSKNIQLIDGQFFDRTQSDKFDLVVFATGSRPNDLTSSWTLTPQFQWTNHHRVFLGGDGLSMSLGFPRNAQVAYEQGKFVATQLNHKDSISSADTAHQDLFTFRSKGLAMYCGDDNFLVEVNFGSHDNKMVQLDLNSGKVPNVVLYRNNDTLSHDDISSKYAVQVLLNVPSRLMKLYYNIVK
jgi:NADH dehydrogenase FAD-containing subunit